MRIIAGTAGGVPLKVPAAITRPTTDRVREAVFSMIGPQIAGTRVLDLFAGSGALGLECLSRGATSADLVDQNRQACEAIRANLAKTRLNGAHVRQADAFRTLSDLARSGVTFDFVFADPPYTLRSTDTDFTAQLLAHPDLLSVMHADSSLILESLAEKGPCAEVQGWETIKERDYGSSRIRWLRPQRSEP